MQTSSLIYLNPIQQDISRRQFQDIARSRMSIYQFLDPFRQKFNQSQLDLAKVDLAKEDQKYLSKDAKRMFEYIYNPWSTQDSEQDRKKDHLIDNLSHYICRLMFCITPENKQNYIAYESMIFKARLFEKVRSNIKQQELFEILSKITGKDTYFVGEIQQMTDQQFKQNKLSMFAACDRRQRFGKKPNYQDMKYQLWNPNKKYRVPMEFCEFLISSRDCYLKKGEAYLYGGLLVKIMPKIYGKYLRLAMDDLERNAYDILSSDQNNQFRQFIRTQPTLLFERKLSPQELKQNLNLKNIAVISKRSFPPCMLQMYDTLITKKHLKHEARLQLTLFLKTAGLSMQDAQHLWKVNYTKGVNDSQGKQIQYAVRHSYGMEGKKADYMGKDCTKIINSKPSTGEYHGCPFKYYGDDELVRFLKAKYPGMLNHQGMLDEILNKKGKNQYEVACRDLFEKVHPDPKQKFPNRSQGVGRHPNSYLFRSEKYYEAISGDHSSK